MKSSRFILAIAATASAIALSQISSATEIPSEVKASEIGSTSLSPKSLDDKNIQMMTSRLTRLKAGIENENRNIHVKLEVTTRGRVITSTGVVVNGFSLDLGDVERRKYISSVSYVDGVKTDEVEASIDLGERISFMPKILNDGTIFATVSFLHTEPVAGAKALPPLNIQNYTSQSIFQTLTLKSGEPVTIASLARPGEEKDLIVTITATIQK